MVWLFGSCGCEFVGLRVFWWLFLGAAFCLRLLIVLGLLVWGFCVTCRLFALVSGDLLAFCGLGLLLVV